MGIDANGVRFLLHAKAVGVDFKRTLMIGRQNLYIEADTLKSLFVSYGYKLSKSEAAYICGNGTGFSENLFYWLGADEVESIDFSPYQEASHVHDMNQPIPSSLKSRYTTVLDGGSLEHIFNFPVAIQNCLEMVGLGGHYLAITPGNNFLGHGFYQFSPELYFTVLAEENGFKTEKMIAFEDTKSPIWYEVRNPRDVRGRVLLCNSNPVYLLVIARKIADCLIFTNWPQQSDYKAIWECAGDQEVSETSANVERSLIIRIAKILLPARFRWLARSIFNTYKQMAQRKGFNPSYFTPID